jgi:uncharacterized protein DUF6527
MSRLVTITHEFVESAPDPLGDGILYISIPFKTALHKCCCGCGREVVTPLSPARWSLIYDGKSISLHPSIGNWSFPCQSHYWIRNDRVVWARKLSPIEIERVRLSDRRAAGRLYSHEHVTPHDPAVAAPVASKNRTALKRALGWLKARIS